MNEKELRELDAWVAQHVLSKKVSGDYSEVLLNTMYESGRHPMLGDNLLRKYTKDLAAASEVLEACFLVESCIEIWNQGETGGEGWTLIASRGDMTSASAETFPLAICLFAKKMFRNLAKP